jgi:hypothetical protein
VIRSLTVRTAVFSGVLFSVFFFSATPARADAQFLKNRVRTWLNPDRFCPVERVSAELANLEARGELDVPEERIELVGLTLERLAELYNSPDPLRTMRVLPQSRALFNFVLSHPASPGCYLTDAQTDALSKLMARVFTQPETDFYAGILDREAACERMTRVDLIRRTTLSGGCIGRACSLPAAPPNPRPRDYLEVGPADFPFYPNGGSIEQPGGVCWGMSNYALHMARNFTFVRWGQRPSTKNVRALFDYDVLMDSSGGALRKAGFTRRDPRWRFIVHGYSNLRELTAERTEYLTLLEDTYYHFQGKPGWGPLRNSATAATQKVLMKESWKPFVDYWLGVWKKNGQSLEDFDRLRDQAGQRGTLQAGTYTSGDVLHSVLVRASQDPNVLLVLDPNHTFPGRYLHMIKRRNGIFIDGYARDLTRVWLGPSAAAPGKIFYQKP